MATTQKDKSQDDKKSQGGKESQGQNSGRKEDDRGASKKS
ncbi:MAG: hypothetical protein K0R65_1465 [Crocinitomicaceae bacterium]|jgi:hypothetical protein|nr:hypothetical protein [Crocinitomicaceae bacterium]